MKYIAVGMQGDKEYFVKSFDFVYFIIKYYINWGYSVMVIFHNVFIHFELCVSTYGGCTSPAR